MTVATDAQAQMDTISAGLTTATTQFQADQTLAQSRINFWQSFLYLSADDQLYVTNFFKAQP